MAPTILIVADGLTGDELATQLGPASTPLAASFLADTLAVAHVLTGARTVVRYSPTFPRAALAGLAPWLEIAPIGGVTGPALAAALGEALASGDPALLIGADTPHLPPWRLRDALTHLAYGADAVAGPSDSGDWYLLGLRAPLPELLGHIPARGAALAGLRRAAEAGGRHMLTLPAWYSVRSGAGLAALAEALRTMPPGVAARTRALLATEAVAARAVGG